MSLVLGSVEHGFLTAEKAYGFNTVPVFQDCRIVDRNYLFGSDKFQKACPEANAPLKCKTLTEIPEIGGGGGVGIPVRSIKMCFREFSGLFWNKSFFLNIKNNSQIPMIFEISYIQTNRYSVALCGALLPNPNPSGPLMAWSPDPLHTLLTPPGKCCREAARAWMVSVETGQRCQAFYFPS